jgi:uncharacterized membrane-anchored protein
MRKHIAAWFCLALASSALAQEAEQQLSAEEQEALAAMVEFWESLEPRSGAITLGPDLATLNVPDGFYFLDTADTIRVLVDLWGNPPEQGDGLLGMLFPAQYTPFDDEAWGVTVEYVDDGRQSGRGRL